MDIQIDFSRVLRKPAVLAATGLTSSALEREFRAGRFPRPFRLSSAPDSRAIGWLASEVAAWIEARAAQREVA